MANEITVVSNLRIRDGYTNYVSQPASFVASIVTTAVAKGPTPGAITVGTQRTLIDLSQLTNPGMAHIANLGVADGSTPTGEDWGLIEIGTYDADVSRFYPILELYPGESYVVRLSRFVNKEITPGTGTALAETPGDARLYAKATHASTVLLFEAFER